MNAANNRRHARTRRNLLKAAAAGGALAAALRASGTAGAASGDTFRIGRLNDAGADQTVLTANKGGAASLVVNNTSPAGVGIRAENKGGYGLWGVGLNAGVRGIGGQAGIIGEANPTSGIGIVGRRGFRSGTLPTNTGVLGYAGFGTGVIGEGGGATGIRGFAGQYDGSSAPVGTGVQGVGTTGVLAQATGSGTGLRAVSSSSGRAIDATGPVRVVGPVAITGTASVAGTLSVAGHINASGTITGEGGTIGVVAKSGTGGTGLKAIAPTDGLAIEAVGDVRMDGDVDVLGVLSGDGSGLKALAASRLVGTVHPDRLPLATARRDKSNSFSKVQEFGDIVRFGNRMISSVAGRATIASGETSVDVELPSNVTVGTGSLVIATPQENPHGNGVFARPIAARRIRISIPSPAPEDLAFGYLVLN